MQKAVESLFRDHTVISIAHRLDTIVAFDMVIVLEKGRVVESGKPRDLLKMNSKFRTLWGRSVDT